MSAGSLDGAKATVNLLEQDAHLAFLLVLDAGNEVLLRMPETGALIPVEGGEELENGLRRLLDIFAPKIEYFALRATDPEAAQAAKEAAEKSSR